MLSICIPYHAGLPYLEACLASIVRYPPRRPYEIVVVQDASPEPCEEWLGGTHSSVRLLVNTVNLGFGGSANRALAECEGDYILVLNADARVLPEALETLCRLLDERPQVGAAGPQILNEDGSFQPQCKRGRLTPLSALGYGLGIDRRARRGSPLADYLRRQNPIHARQRVAALSGSCMLLRREALVAVRGFDESLFLYGEDLDLCYRLDDAGWQVVYEPGARVVHVGGQGGTSLRFFRSLYHYHRSAFMVLRRSVPGRAFYSYGWIFAAAFAVRFASHAASAVLGYRRLATAKGRLRPLRRTRRNGAPSRSGMIRARWRDGDAA